MWGCLVERARASGPRLVCLGPLFCGRIAVEAVLIYGLGYNGLKFDPDYARAILDGEVLTRRDFGYTR